jgi:hypothetical protein
MSSLYYMLRGSVFVNSHANSANRTNTQYQRMDTDTIMNREISRRDADEDRCNYSCPTCRKSGKMPTLSGRFHIINDKECQCNACYSIFDKNIFYKKTHSREYTIPSSNPATNYQYNLYSMNGIKNYLRRSRNTTNNLDEVTTVDLNMTLADRQEVII